MFPKEYSFPEAGGAIEFEENGTILGKSVGDGDYIVMDATNLGELCVSVLWRFWDKPDGPEAESIKMGLLPHLRTRLALPVSAVRGEKLFLSRTPGKLKTVVQGRPVDPAAVVRFSVGLDRGPKPMRLAIHSLYISPAAPDFPLEGEPLVDELGQRRRGDWPGKTASREELCAYLRAEGEKLPPSTPEGFGKYGGSLKKSFPPTGFFALREEDGAYWLADPEGRAFFSVGPDCVGVDGECAIEGIGPLCGGLEDGGRLKDGFYSWTKANLVRAFGEDWYEKWTRLTLRRLREWGCNTIACWSDPRFIKAAKMPYVHILHGFPRTESYVFRDFPDVFDPAYAEASRRWAEQLAPLKSDPFMVGYFMSNEPNWAFVNDLDVAKIVLKGRAPLKSRARLAELLAEKYGDIAALNAVWGTEIASFANLADGGLTLPEASAADTAELTERMIREFVRVPALALREIDPNHLNLGMRYAWLSSPALAAGKEFFDVFSFNCYRHDPYPSIERMVEMVKMPVMIGEFHFGAADRGLDATGIQAVATQDDRARAYRYYMHRCASHPMCVGAHYFNYNDQPYLGRFDGENYQIGLVDVCNRPYPEFAAAVARSHREVYDVRLGLMPPADDAPLPVESIFY